jgi:hypothetical protein
VIEHREYHLAWNEPNEVWPLGSWSVYQIGGDDIAERIIFERVNVDGYYEGDVIARHSWSGYLGMVDTLDGAKALIELDMMFMEDDLAKALKQR